MEVLKIEIIDPRAMRLIQKMQASKLIKISGEPVSKIKDYLSNMRKNSDSAPTIEEISQMVEEVRSERYAKKNKS